MKIDILILNYNGKDLLKSYLSSVCIAAKASRHNTSVYVVDNVSTDGSVEYLRKNFPEVNIIEAPQNNVLCSYNDAVRPLASDIVIFLNNDIKVDEDFVDYLTPHFEDENVMFVAPRLMNFDNTYNGGKSFIKFKNGAIKVLVDYDNFMEGGMTHAISTGAFRRNMFLEFAGFDDLYLPGIWEDVDICFRAMAMGRKGVYEPKSLIWHAESTTFNREYGKKRKMIIAHRNMFLFFWKNITDMKMFTIHILLTLPRAIFLFLTGKSECLMGFIAAMRKLPVVLIKRKANMVNLRLRVKSDKAIIG